MANSSNKYSKNINTRKKIQSNRARNQHISRVHNRETMSKVMKRVLPLITFHLDFLHKREQDPSIDMKLLNSIKISQHSQNVPKLVLYLKSIQIPVPQLTQRHQHRLVRQRRPALFKLIRQVKELSGLHIKNRIHSFKLLHVRVLQHKLRLLQRPRPQSLQHLVDLVLNVRAQDLLSNEVQLPDALLQAGLGRDRRGDGPDLVLHVTEALVQGFER